MKHPFDPRTQVGIEQALWHADPNLEALVRDIFARYKPNVFIETGTHMGWTAHWVATNYPDVQVYTVEIDADFYQRARENLCDLPNVHIEHDDSVHFLWKLRQSLSRTSTIGTIPRSVMPKLVDSRPLFWLDAHWNPPVPLREECRIVAGLPRYVCLIDDFQCWGPDFGGDTFYTRFSTDYTKSGPEGGGEKYHNDLSYVLEPFSEVNREFRDWITWADHYRPNYEPRPGNNGVGLFVHDDVDYTPPSTWRAESVKQFLASRPASAYPLHPSFEVVR